MEKIAVRKNVFAGFCVLYWLLALIMLLTDKTQEDKDAKKIYVTSLVFAVLFAACSIIPFVGWLVYIPAFVFYVMAVVNMFKGNYDYNVPVIGGIINNFANK